MNIPNLPSDNLNKFVAVGCLFLAISTLVFKYQYELALKAKIESSRGELGKTITKAMYLRSLIREHFETLLPDSKYIKPHMDSLSMAINYAKFKADIKIEAINIERAIRGSSKPEYQPISETSREIYNSIDDLNAELLIIDLYTKEFNSFRVIVNIMIFIVSIFSLWGFTRWYRMENLHKKENPYARTR
jgi:hypothetical protein